jgi:hypothetical protein
MVTPNSDFNSTNGFTPVVDSTVPKVAALPNFDSDNNVNGNIAITDRSPRDKVKQDAAMGDALKALAPQSYIAAVGWSPDNAAGTAGGKVLVAGLINAPKTNRGDVMGAINEGSLFVSVTLPGQTAAKVFTYNPSNNKWTMGNGTAKAIAGGRVVGFANAQAGGKELSINGKSQPGAVGAGSAGVLVRVDEPVRFVKGLIKGADTLAKAMLAGEVITTGGAAVPAVALQNYARLFAVQAAKNVADSTKVYVGVGYAANVSLDATKFQLVGFNGKLDLPHLAAAYGSPTREQLKAVQDREVWIERQNRYPSNPATGPGRQHKPTAFDGNNQSMNPSSVEQSAIPNKLLLTVEVGNRALAYRDNVDGTVSLFKPSEQNGEPLMTLKAGTTPENIRTLMQINPAVAKLGESVNVAAVAPDTNNNPALRTPQMSMG